MKKLLIAVSLSVLLISISIFLTASPRPSGQPSDEADDLARAMMAAVEADAWTRTGALRWTFRGDRSHLWDRERQLVRVRWKKNEVFVDLKTQEGRVWQGGEELQGEKAAELVDKAWKAWINDSFWLNPVVKAFDEGTVRSLIDLDDGGRGLLVEYTSGGATPGDAYLWILGEDALPTAWKMWTSNLPKGGMKASWQGWISLATGARVATVHKLAVGKVNLSDVAGAATLQELEPGPDPFARFLVEG